MGDLKLLKEELFSAPDGGDIRPRLRHIGFVNGINDQPAIMRAKVITELFTGHRKYIYDNDMIVGSSRGFFSEPIDDNERAVINKTSEIYSNGNFWTNVDHYAPDYETFLSDGVSGVLQKLRTSASVHKDSCDSEKKLTFLHAAELSIEAFSEMILQYGEAAEEKSHTVPSDMAAELICASQVCRRISVNPPQTFREALQLLWLCHTAFRYEGRYAMAFGRMDQYLYRFYCEDIRCGTLTREYAVELVSRTLVKIYEERYRDRDDVVNIVIGGVDPKSGKSSVNELSYVILEAVHRCNIPGPNLSARISPDTPDKFLDECLRVIGTGLGYPALMNDSVNIPALRRHGYSEYDSRNHCMVGCIENFIQGCQPPWSDGRFNFPKYLELALNSGKCMLTGVKLGVDTPPASELKSIGDLLSAFDAQLRYGAAEYAYIFNHENDRYNRERYVQPFLSCFCRGCIESALDINDGGALYPSAHGACLVGIGTVADSLAAIERVVFDEGAATAEELRNAMVTNFEGNQELRSLLLRAPKYGNNDDFVDKYAVWFVEKGEELFSQYRTRDGGAFYTAIASNTSNIPAGKEIAATPDGRLAREPVSDAASPMHGMDRRGPTAVVNSISKPDYTLVSCGTVLNQKFSPSAFVGEENIAKLRGLIRVYFNKGGQEMQINSVSRSILTDAMNNPDAYRDLVVRVSGFSAYYITLSKEVQRDILMRTEH